MRQLPAARVRLALPWGDSAYTSAVYQRHPTEWWPKANWCLGPIENGLTPSSEGPRRRDEAEARVLNRMLDRARAKRLERMLLPLWGMTKPTWDAVVGRAPYVQPLPHLDGRDRVGWVDQHGTIHTGVITDRRDTARGTELDFVPDEEGSTP